MTTTIYNQTASIISFPFFLALPPKIKIIKTNHKNPNLWSVWKAFQMTSFYFKCLNVDVTGKASFLSCRTNEHEDFCQNHLKEEWSAMPLKELPIFFLKGVPGKCSSTILNLNLLLGILLLAEEVEQKPALVPYLEVPGNRDCHYSGSVLLPQAPSLPAPEWNN